MANYANLKAAIQQVIKTNGNEEITGALLQQSLLAMINSLGGYYQFAGIATPSTNPGTPDQNVFYLASTAGTYANFGSIVIAENEAAILKYNGTWSKDSSGFATSEKVSQLDADVNGINIQGNYTPGKYVDKYGVLQDNPVAGASDFIEYIPGKSVYWNWGGVQWNSSACLVFYDANKNPISGAYWTSIQAAGELTIPAAHVQQYAPNAAYVRLSFRLAQKDVATYRCDSVEWFPETPVHTEGLAGAVSALTNEVEELGNEVEELGQSVSNVDARFDGRRQNWESGYLDADGAIQPSTDDIVTDYIPVSAGDTIEWYNGFSETKSVYLQVYHNSGYALSDERRAANSVPSRTFTLSSNYAYYAAIRATMSATNRDAYIKVNGVKVWERKDGVDGVLEHPIELLGKTDTLFGEGDYNNWRQGYIHNGTGTWYSSSVNSYTGFIDIRGYKKIKITQSITQNASNAGICFYAEDGTFLSGVAPQTGSEKSYQTVTLDVPENAAFVRASIYTDQISHWSLIGIVPSAIESNVPALPPMLGSPELYFSGATSESAVSINTKSAAELYAEYDALVAAYPQYLKRDADLGEVTYNGNTYAIRAYTLGYNKQTLIDHEPTADEVISAASNKWTEDLNPRKILLVSGMHGDEHTPCWGMMLAIVELLASDEPWAHYIKDNFIFKVVPCVNPAGWTAHLRGDSQGHVMNRDEAINDPESTYYMNWVDANKDAFILIDCHGTQGRYAYLPVMQRLPIAKMVYGLANKLACAFFGNWKSFYDSISNGYGTTYAPFMVAKYTPDTYWTRGRYACRMYQDYGMQSFALETPDDLVTGQIAQNDLRNCKLTKDIFVNVLQAVCQMQVLPK